MTGKYFYDLHIHSCLSPCADDDMTPGDIAGMGAVAKLDIMALTDHNSCKNCPAFFEAAKHYGIIPVPGMELTTAEDIHLICLFPSLESAMSFDSEVDSKRIPIKNRTDIFGNQLIMNFADEIIGEEENLLSNATVISVEEAPGIARKHGGVCYPAHIDRQANGIIAVLGTFPESPFFPCAELHDKEKQAELKSQYSVLADKPFVFSSDAHSLWQINGRENFIELCGETPDEIRQTLIDKLKNNERNIT